MEGTDFDIEVSMLKDLKFAEREAPTDIDLEEFSDEFDGYRRSHYSLIVTATPNDSEFIAGMGGGCIYENPEKLQMLWIQSAEVNEPYRRKGLERMMIGALVEAAESMGFAGACIAKRLSEPVNRSNKRPWWKIW